MSKIKYETCVCGGTLKWYEEYHEWKHITPPRTNCFLVGNNFRNHCPKIKQWWNRWDTEAMRKMILMLELFNQQGGF